MKKHTAAHVIFAATAIASQPACALGFGRVASDAVLGQPLVFTAPVHVEAGERFGSDCVSAEVYFGDSRVAPGDVRTSVERGASDTEWIVKVATAAPIPEPIVDVAISAGCDRRFVRRFTAFADPPSVALARAGAPAPAPAPTLPVVLAPATPEASSGTSARAPRVADATTGTGGRAPAAPARNRAPSRKGPTVALAAEQAAAKAAATPAAGRHGANRKAGVQAPPPATAAAPAEAAPRLVLDSGYAHLKLDMEEPVIPPPGAASGPGATIALSELDDPAIAQLKALEQSLQAVKRDNAATREQTAKLQAQLAQAQTRGDWLPWVLGLLAIAVAALVALALRLRHQQRLAHSAWFNESQVAPSGPGEAATPAPGVPATPTEPSALDLLGAAPAVPPDYAPAVDHLGLDLGDEPSGAVVSDMSATAPLDRAALAGLLGQGESATPRELSVEELLDLEQQADFFIALGQEDAAVDLLMAHLRSAGGQSPLPYTKLLEIYRRQGDRSAYERTRARFNRRFNAYAPDWDTGPTAGRQLEDYPETMAHVQAVWNSPIDAMAILEAMLFKRDESSELFDLPAYRDVLLLYSLARDLWQLGGGLTGTQVDVLLPLDDRPGAAISGLALPLEGDGTPSTFEMTRFDGSPRHEIDLQVPLGDEHGGAVTDHHVDDAVHVTLDEFSLAPNAPTPPPSAPHWDSETSDDPERPKRR